MDCLPIPLLKLYTAHVVDEYLYWVIFYRCHDWILAIFWCLIGSCVIQVQIWCKQASITKTHHADSMSGYLESVLFNLFIIIITGYFLQYFQQIPCVFVTRLPPIVCLSIILQSSALRDQYSFVLSISQLHPSKYLAVFFRLLF